MSASDESKIRVILDPKMENGSQLNEAILFLDGMLHSIKIIIGRVTLEGLRYTPGLGYIKSNLLEKLESEVSKDAADIPIIFITRGRVFNDVEHFYKQNINILSLYEIHSKPDELLNWITRTLFRLIVDLYPLDICNAERQYFNSTKNFPYNSGEPLKRRRILPLDNAVMTIHGMGTEGKWQTDLASFLKDWGFFSSDYGKFYKVIWPSERKHLRDTIIADKYSNFLEKFPAKEYRHHIIAHSFGTYVFTDYLLTYGAPSYPDNILFVASILRVNTDWTKIIENGTRIICECAGKDKVVCLAPLLRLSFAEKAGRSGVKGFRVPRKAVLNIKDTGMSNEEFVNTLQEHPNKGIINVFYPYKEHSNFFIDSHFKNRWLPLLGTHPLIL